MTKLRIGVTGYSAQKFDQEEAELLLNSAFDAINMKYPDRQSLTRNEKPIRAVRTNEKIVVSGLTNLGIPGLAYRLAEKRGWKTIGIACSKAEEYECWPVNKKIIVGKEWGDESQTFLDSIDILIRIGGGQQAKRETETFKKTNKPVIEFELETIKK